MLADRSLSWRKLDQEVWALALVSMQGQYPCQRQQSFQEKGHLQHVGPGMKGNFALSSLATWLMSVLFVLAPNTGLLLALLPLQRSQTNTWNIIHL